MRNHASLDQVQHAQVRKSLQTPGRYQLVCNKQQQPFTSAALLKTVKASDPAAVQDAARRTLQEAAGLDWRRESCRPTVPIL